MKFTLTVLAALTALTLGVFDQRASGASILSDTNGTRINDWNFSGCNDSPGAAGAPASGDNGAGGNQASCATCPDDGGMARWSVDEPNINVHVSDTPLEYITSSGQKVSFRLFYKQRFLVPPTDQCASCQNVYTNSLDGVNMHNMGLMNASWNHNWLMDMEFWDAPWSALKNGGTNPPYPIYSDCYEAMVFYPQGDVQYYYSNLSSATYTGDPQRQTGLKPLSGLGYPTVAYGPLADSNGFYWGAPAPSTLGGSATTNGFKIVYPDGSQDLLSLTYPTVQGAHAFLTQRIDPAGRVTQLGYEKEIIGPGPGGSYYTTFRVKYLVDSDGRTNTFYYNSSGNQHYPWELQQIVSPYGQTATFTEYDVSGGAGQLASITDAQSNTTSFGYTTFQSTNYWLNSIATPYGTTSFTFYELPGDTNIPFSFAKRAIYVSEPDGAQQFYLFIHSNTNGVPANLTDPIVTNLNKFDDGSGTNVGSSNVGSSLYGLSYRNTFHWGRRQFMALSSNVVTALQSGNLTNAVNDLTAADYMKAHLSHWLLQAASSGYVTDDGVSLSELISMERDPSPDAAGTISGAWTWYNYANKYYGAHETGDSQVNCIAQILPNGQTQYTRYNYNYNFGGPPSAGLVSDNETSVTLANGTVGELTNWFNYAANAIDLTSTSNSMGQYVNLTYNSTHQVTSISNAVNQVTSYVWGISTNVNHLDQVSLPNGQTIYFDYYYPVLTNHPLSNTTAMLEQIEIEPEGRYIYIPTYTNGLPQTVEVFGTGIPTLITTNSWDGLNRLTGTAFQDGTAISNVYTILDLTAHKDRVGNWSHAGYDALEHLTSITNANQAVSTLTWCGCGSLTSITDALTNQTYLNYDNQGRLTNKSYADGSSITYQFDLNGRMTNVFDGSTRSVQLAYNVQGLVTNVSNIYGPLSKVVYDPVGRPIKITDANNVTVTNGYDAVNRLIARVWTTDGIGEYFVYAPNGLIAYTNRNQQATLFGRDGAGRVTSITNANLEVTQFGYDALDRLTSLIDGLSHTTRWNYNQYGWVTNKVDASNHQAFAYSYNANGWLTNRWSPASTNTSYFYDPVGNLTNISYPGSLTPAVSYAFDILNRLTNMIDGVGTNRFTYTPTGQLLSETGPWISNTLTYSYLQGHRASLTQSQPTGVAWTNTYAYDGEWRLTGLTAPSGSFAYAYPASASALIQTLALPNAAYIGYQYDSLARLTNTALANYWGHVLDGYSYSYDYLGQRTNITRNLGLTTNSVAVWYDNIGQVIAWTAQEASGTPRQNEQLGYGYDAADNLHLRTNGALVQTFSVDSLNQLSNVTRSGTLTFAGATPAPATNITVNGQVALKYGDFTFAATNNTLSNGTNTFTTVATNLYGVAVTNILAVNLPATNTFQYDANGSLASDDTRFMVYDAENRLTNIYVTNLWKTEFVYDGFGRRRIVRDYKWQSGWVRTNETRLVCDGMLPVQERDSNNVVQVTYTRGLDLSLSLGGAGGIGGVLARTDTNGSVFYHSDGSGNITSMMNGYQEVVARYEYDAFLRIIGQWGTMAAPNVMRSSSMPNYAKDGIVGFPLREYDLILPRWLQHDPSGEAGGINLYRFVGNSPINSVDPYGLSIGNYLGFSGGPADANAAMEALVQAHGYANMREFAQDNPSYHGWNPLDRVTPARDAAVASTDLYINTAQAIVPAGIAAKGTEAAAQGIADAVEEGWLSKLWNKCKFWKKGADTPSPGLRGIVPLDLTKYAPLESTKLLGPGVEDGTYAFVQDIRGKVWIADNGMHVHPQILGNATPVASAGEITVKDGVVTMINNESGTFTPAASTLNRVQGAAEAQGMVVNPGAIQAVQH